MFCSNCGNQIDESQNEYCPFCGIKLSDSVPTQPKTQSIQASSPYAKMFVSPDENYVTAMGSTGHVIDLFTSASGRKGCGIVLSDQRLYYHTNSSQIEIGKYKKCNYQKTVDLDDITGTAFAHANPNIFILILSILNFVACVYIYLSQHRLFNSNVVPYLCIVTLIFGIIWLIVYLTSRYAYFYVEYPGGNIQFAVSSLGLKDAIEFEKSVRIAKDALKKKRN